MKCGLRHALKILAKLGGGNVVTGSPVFSEGAKIIFRGEGNVLLCEEGVTLSGVIDFKGNDAVVYLARNKYAYSLNLTMWHETTCYMGEDNYFNGRLSAIVSERRSLIIGDNCLFSFGIWIRTADPHLIYDAKSMARINCSKDVFIGDHVWVGQDAKLLKGAIVGSGSILAAGAIASGKPLSSNCSFGGIPAKLLSEDVFFTAQSVHAYSSEMTQQSMKYKGKQSWVFSPSHDSLNSIHLLLESLQGANSADRVEILKNIRSDKRHNRFAVSKPDSKPQKNSFAFLKRIKRALR